MVEWPDRLAVETMGTCTLVGILVVDGGHLVGGEINGEMGGEEKLCVEVFLGKVHERDFDGKVYEGEVGGKVHVRVIREKRHERESGREKDYIENFLGKVHGNENVRAGELGVEMLEGWVTWVL